MLYSVMDVILEQLGGTKSVVVAVKSSAMFNHYGTIVLGDDRPRMCAEPWTVYPTHSSSFIQMAIYANEIEIGKYHRVDKISLAFNEDALFLDADSYDAAVKALGVDKDHNNQIDCNIKTEIIISAEDNQWTIKPKDYIDKDFDGAHCHFRVSRSRTTVILPLSFLNGRCLAYDFAKRTVAIGKLKTN